ncbi:hypothetical protein GCM10010168_93480 [Actinoplanes ianthinogenes]|uniref:Uncharacterized protein n=1 Tax=Actinoplanes ianthinogenes TaxID=122358 RepID=A0ABM7LKK6_9ACTN|nr:hypothetical protein Aiant_04360 [Actinoplanes ianthinogenes]GGR59979.1 hypothetical protein GCM10010168_93480 [Actinoplanes ianthinogenes]
MNEAALTEPNFTAAGLARFSEENPVPVTVTEVPPAVGPAAGVIAVTVGTFTAGADADGLADGPPSVAPAFAGDPARVTATAAVATVTAAAAPRACLVVAM